MNSWIKACKLDQVKTGQLFAFSHDDKKILLANQKGKIYATDLICTHADADLSTGFLSDEGVRCPLHLLFLIYRVGGLKIFLQKYH